MNTSTKIIKPIFSYIAGFMIGFIVSFALFIAFLNFVAYPYDASKRTYTYESIVLIQPVKNLLVENMVNGFGVYPYKKYPDFSYLNYFNYANTPNHQDDTYQVYANGDILIQTKYNQLILFRIEHGGLSEHSIPMGYISWTCYGAPHIYAPGECRQY